MGGEATGWKAHHDLSSGEIWPRAAGDGEAEARAASATRVRGRRRAGIMGGGGCHEAEGAAIPHRRRQGFRASDSAIREEAGEEELPREVNWRRWASMAAPALRKSCRSAIFMERRYVRSAWRMIEWALSLFWEGVMGVQGCRKFGC